jgi:hypothetical protein
VGNQGDDRNITEAVESPLYDRVETEKCVVLPSEVAEDKSDNNETVAVVTPFFDPNITQAVDDDSYHFAETQAPYNATALQAPTKKVYAEDEESALKPEQRALLDVVARLSDVETFEETEKALSREEEEALLRRRSEELTQVESDKGPFEIPALREVLEDETSLSEDQIVHMEVAARLADKETFSQRSEKYAEMNQDGFTKRDLVEMPSVSEQAIDAAALDAIPTPPSVEDVVFPTPPPVSALEQRKKPENLVGRARQAMHDMPYVMRRARKRMMQPDRVLGPVVFVSLTLAVFLLPGYLQKTMATSSAETSGLDQVNAHVSQELDKQVPDALNDTEVAGAASTESEQQGSSSGAIMGGGGGGGGPQGSSSGEIGSGIGGESVIQARALASKGYTKRAHELYKAYLAMHPKSMPVRIELIRMLIAGKEKRLARIECIEALKLSPTYEQTQEIAGLFQQVQLD